MENIKSIIESLLFVVDKPISSLKLASIIEIDETTLINTLNEMSDEYLNKNDRGIKLVEVAKGWQLRTKQENIDWLKKLENHRPIKLSPSALEVLAIVAYKQPITKQDLEKIRGVDSLHLIKTLLEKNLIRISGRSVLPGKPLLYSTSNDFLEFFNLKSIDELPSSQEIKAMFEGSVGTTNDLENMNNLFSQNSEEFISADSDILDEVERISKELNIDLDLVQEKVDIIFEESYRKKHKNQFGLSC